MTIPTPGKYARALLLRLNFEIACEAYDRILPGWWWRDRDGRPLEWIPEGGRPRAESTRFRRESRERMLREAASLHMSDDDMRAAEIAADRLSYDEQIKMRDLLEQAPAAPASPPQAASAPPRPPEAE